MQIRYYFLTIFFYFTMPSHLALGNSPALPKDSQYSFVSQPRPPRIYARAPSGVSVTKVLAKLKISNHASEQTFKAINFPDETTVDSLNAESDDDFDDNLPKSCFPHYYLRETDAGVGTTFAIGKCDGAISTARDVMNEGLEIMDSSLEESSIERISPETFLPIVWWGSGTSCQGGLLIVPASTCSKLSWTNTSQLTTSSKMMHISHPNGIVSVDSASYGSFIDNPVGYVYNVTVLANDLLNFTLASTDVKIEVTEFNSRAPYLIQEHYSQEVLDIMKVGDLLTTITAGDNDTESYNKELYYYLQEKSKIDLDPWLYPETSPLDANVASGEIRLTSSLTNLSSPLYYIVGVGDGGSPQRFTAVNMTIHIRNMSAPGNVKILNTTETSIVVCWSAPFQGVPKGYLILSQPRSPNTRYTAASPLNVTVQQLESGTVGFLYEDEEKNFYSPQYCATLEGLIPHITYAVSIRAWADGKISMARMPVTTLTMKKSCFESTCVHGVCQEQNSYPGFSCRCLEEYYGERCELTNPCFGNICENEGTCIRKTYGTKPYECKCQHGFMGDKCEKKNICVLANPCQNQGTCLIDYDGEYRCSCRSRYNGTNCEIKDSDLFLTMCHSVNSSYPEGEFQWPSTFKGNTAFLLCPFGVKDSFLRGDTDSNSSDTEVAEMEYDEFGQVHFSNIPPLELTNYSYSSEVRTDDSPEHLPRSRRSVLKGEAEITISYVPTNDQQRNGRYFRSVDSSVLTSDMSTGLPSMPTVSSSESLSQRRLSQSVSPHHASRASARVGVPGATRACVENDSGDTMWQEPILSFCKSSPADVNIEIPTPSPEKITPKIFVESAKSLSHLLDKAISDKGVAKRMLDAISNLLNVNRSVFSSSEEDTYNATDSIMETIDTYTSKVPLLPGQNIILRAENLVVEAKVLNTKNLPNLISFHPFVPTDEFGSQLGNESSTAESGNLIRKKRAAEESNLDTLWIKVPKEALKNAVSENVRFQFVSFKDDRLFRSKNQKTSLNMPVVSATISNSHICNLDTPVLYRIPVTGFDADKMNPVCVYWEKTSKTWSSEGISTKVIGESEIQCESNHLTSFSIVLDPIALPTDSWHSQILSIISSIGLTISTVALGATIATFALFRSLNRDRSGIIVMNLAIALLLLNISFLGAANQKPRSWACIPFATLLHYSVIASFAWMLLEAQNMYQLLVTVFPSAETHFMLKRLAFGWGVPFLFVVLALIWNNRIYVNRVSGYCIISPVSVPDVYYATYLTPIVLVLTVNLVVFFKVTAILCQRRPSYGRNSKSSPDKPSHKSPPFSLAQFRGAVTIVALLGITWLSGIFAVGNLRLFLQYCFCITTPLQGLIIFVVRVLQSAEARIAWRTFVLTGSLRRRHPTQISSVRTHSSHNSSSANTQSSGVSPPNILASALRKFSLGSQNPNSFTGFSSKGRSSCNSNQSKHSNKGRKHASNNVDNHYCQSDVKKEPAYLHSSEPESDLTENNTHNRNSFAYSSLLYKEGDTHTIYESRLEDEPLKDFKQFLDTHPFFDKTRSNNDLHDRDNIDRPIDDKDYVIPEPHEPSSKDENINLSYQVYLLNERNTSSTSNLSPQKKLSDDLLNKNMRRSLGSLLSKSEEMSRDSQLDSPPWNLVRLPPDGTCDPDEYESPINNPEEFIIEKKLSSDDLVNRLNSIVDKVRQIPKNEINQGVSGNLKDKVPQFNMYDMNDSTESDNTENMESKGLLIPVLNLPRAASYQNVSVNKIPLTDNMKRSVSINELGTSHLN